MSRKGNTMAREEYVCDCDIIHADVVNSVKRNMPEESELYDLSDGSGEGSMPYAIAVYGDDVFSAGTLFGTSRTAAVWHGEKILHTLTDGTGHGEVYSMFVVPLYD